MSSRIVPSWHAIDRASTRLHKLWKKTRADRNEGLATWLMRICDDAILIGVREKLADGTFCVRHFGYSFIFRNDGRQLILITVHEGKPHSDRYHPRVTSLLDDQEAA